MERPKIARRTPEIVELKGGVHYAWCACGKSKNQPWCDGSHADTHFTPKVFSVDHDMHKALCMCKQSANQPFCDGNHAEIAG